MTEINIGGTGTKPDAGIENLPEQKEMYPPDVAFRATFAARDHDETIILGRTSAERTTRQQLFTGLAPKTGLSPYGVLKDIYNATIDAEVAERRAVGTAAHEARADAEALQLQDMNEQGRQLIESTYGGRAEAEALLARVTKFVAQFPELKTLLQKPSVGSRPEIVKALVDHVREVNFR